MFVTPSSHHLFSRSLAVLKGAYEIKTQRFLASVVCKHVHSAKLFVMCDNYVIR